MKERNIKIVIVFLIITMIYAGIIILLNRVKDKSMVLLFAENDIFEYKNNVLIKTDKINEDLKYSVYINNSYFGEYNIKNNSGFKLYTNNELTNYDGSFFAYTNNINIKNKKISNVFSENDLLKINLLIGSINKMEDLLIKEKYIVDLDNNGINDQIVNASNLDGYVEAETYFNLVYVILNNTSEQILIKEIVEPKNVLVNPRYSIYSIFNINNSNYDNIVLQRWYFSLGGEPNVMIYEYINNQYSKNIN